ncbi:MarR family transcriptional regulator [Paenibacillus sp. CFBP13512]|uniref:MarR family winged helix-turn-helix transcriptional regulator n=1 Tax=Paenibacillus sp. CFBP13512 TaxID=2184007 RepID=UPI0010BFE6F5|nr:MarR family transcriptional regulator [Paenibacillus sp. CFBP13512]TKJ91046.1 MarR family transcriptional regulator [Paenibacillus sp. CFBP13512]
MLNYNACAIISKIRDDVNKLIITELAKNNITDVVPSHGDILCFLYSEKGSLSVNTLAQKVHRTQPTVTVLVNKLEKLGYVKRLKNDEDQRITMVHLTDKGWELEPIFNQVSEAINHKVYSRLSEQEQEQFEYLLERVYSGL